MFNTPSPDTSMMARKDPGVPPDLQVLLAKQQVDKALQALQSAQAMVQGQQGQGMPTVSELLGQQVQQQVQQLSQPAPQTQYDQLRTKAGGLQQLAQQQQMAQGPQAPQAAPPQLPRQPTQQMARGGIVHLKSNLPGSYAGGGIVAFDEGGAAGGDAAWRTQRQGETDGDYSIRMEGGRDFNKVPQSTYDAGNYLLNLILHGNPKTTPQARQSAALAQVQAPDKPAPVDSMTLPPRVAMQDDPRSLGAPPALSPEVAAAVSAAMTPPDTASDETPAYPATQTALPPQAKGAVVPQGEYSADGQHITLGHPEGADAEGIRNEITAITQEIRNGNLNANDLAVAKGMLLQLQNKLQTATADPVNAVDTVRQQQAPTAQDTVLQARRKVQDEQDAVLYAQQQKAILTDAPGARTDAMKLQQDMVGNRVDSGVAEQRQGLAGLQAAYANATKPVSHLNIFGVDTGLPQVPADIHARAGFAGAISSMKTNEYTANLAKQQQAIKGAEAYQTALHDLVAQNVAGGTATYAAGQKAFEDATGVQKVGLQTSAQLGEWKNRSLDAYQSHLDATNVLAQARVDAATQTAAGKADKLVQDNADKAAKLDETRQKNLDAARGKLDTLVQQFRDNHPLVKSGMAAFNPEAAATVEAAVAAERTRLYKNANIPMAETPTADPNAALMAAAQAEKLKRAGK